MLHNPTYFSMILGFDDRNEYYDAGKNYKKKSPQRLEGTC